MNLGASFKNSNKSTVGVRVSEAVMPRSTHGQTTSMSSVHKHRACKGYAHTSLTCMLAHGRSTHAWSGRQRSTHMLNLTGNDGTVA